MCWCMLGDDEQVAAYLPEQLWGGIRDQDGRGHVGTDPVELLDLPPPGLQQAPPPSVHPLPPRPLALQVERKARLLPLSPAEHTEGTIVLSGGGGEKRKGGVKEFNSGGCSLERRLRHRFGRHGDVSREVLPGQQEADGDAGVELEMHHRLTEFKGT